MLTFRPTRLHVEWLTLLKCSGVGSNPTTATWHCCPPVLSLSIFLVRSTLRNQDICPSQNMIAFLLLAADAYWCALDVRVKYKANQMSLYTVQALRHTR